MIEPIRCGCGGEAYVDTLAQIMGVSKPWFRVVCDKCETQTDTYDTEAEAIMAWNRAMGERSAKVKVRYCVGYCECGQVVNTHSTYCHNCGARLEWSGNEQSG